MRVGTAGGVRVAVGSPSLNDTPCIAAAALVPGDALACTSAPNSVSAGGTLVASAFIGTVVT